MTTTRPVLDHLVIATDSLEAGCNYLQERLGVTMDAGGRHDGYGTHNRLLGVGGGTYLELIAPDPDQPEPERPRPFGLDEPQLRARIAVRPRLVHYIVRTDDIEATAGAMHYDPGPAKPMTRGQLSWRVASRFSPGALANPLPGMIEWGDQPSPGLTMPPRGVVLSRFHVLADAGKLASLALLAEDRRIHLREQSIDMLAAEFITPRGWVILD
ncbi:MAG: VOC family protein [Burkholderiaceae bacterium]